MEELINKVIQWANDRNLIKGSDAKTQCLKLMSEFGELGESSYERKDISDDIGDCIVVCIILSQIGGYDIKSIFHLNRHLLLGKGNYLKSSSVLGRLSDQISKGQQYDILLSDFVAHIYATSYNFGSNPHECLNHAYVQIKDRTGILYQGVYIKESDERYESAVREIRGEV